MVEFCFCVTFEELLHFEMTSIHVKESFSYWATHANDTNASDVIPLEEASVLYPYCQILHILAAKAVAMHEPERASEVVQTAAAHALSRNVLRKLIQNEFEWSAHLSNPQAGLVWPSDYQKMTSKSWQLPELPQLSSVYLPATKPIVENLPESPPIDESALRENTLQNELEQITARFREMPQPNWQGLERSRQMEIIDSYIENEIKMGPIRANLKEMNAEHEDLIKKRNHTPLEGMVSEGMAKVMVRQGKIERAIEIYEQLILKKPEKKPYFAEKIKELNNE